MRCLQSFSIKLLYIAKYMIYYKVSWNNSAEQVAIHCFK